MSYVPVKLNLSAAQQKKLIAHKSVRVLKSDIGKGSPVYLHPLNAKKLSSCKKGCNLSLSKGEIIFTAKHFSPTLGSGFFDDVWSGIKSVGSWLKDSGVGSILADVAQTVATPFVGPEIANVGRQLLKTTTGVGLMRPKGKSQKTKRISIMPSGGSFLIN